MQINEFFNEFDFDIRKSGDGRWCDQKCTPDVICIIAECVLQYCKQTDEEYFTSKDIWNFDYTTELIELYFNKPKPNDKKAINEYDKFFQQPLNLLSYSKVILREKRGNRNFYKINNSDILNFISRNDKNSYLFLVKYFNKVLKDSDLLNEFNIFFETQDTNSFKNLKNIFENFIIKYTNINGRTEVRRIFPKVLNTLACYNKKKGTYRGQLSKNTINFSDLLYNSLNFRDIYSNKPKEITRQEWMEKQELKPAIAVIEYKSNRAIKFIREYNDNYRKGYSEAYDEHQDLGTHFHHIFPKSEFPEISFYYENIIALSPTQHLTYAHPKGDTHNIDMDYQIFLLYEKAKRIYENIENKDVPTIYDFENFVEILNKGFNKNYPIEDISYKKILKMLHELTRKEHSL